MKSDIVSPQIGNAMNYVLYLIILLGFLEQPAFATEPQWFLMSREGVCMGLERLAKREKLPKTPATPDEYAQMMIERGYQVTQGLPEEFTSEFSGKVVQVKVLDGMTLIFVRKGICRQEER